MVIYSPKQLSLQPHSAHPVTYYVEPWAAAGGNKSAQLEQGLLVLPNGSKI